MHYEWSIYFYRVALVRTSHEPPGTRAASKKELKRVFVVAAGYKLLRSVQVSQGYGL